MILNFGSLNIDHVYQVEHFVQPGESMTCPNYSIFAGGKGFNQSIAIARSGAKVCHIGQIGKDGVFLKEYLEKNQVSTQHLIISETPTGHAIIQVDRNGENCIIIFGGANKTITENQIKKALEADKESEFILLQNEINNIQSIVNQAYSKNKKIFLNPSPFTNDLLSLPLQKIHTLIMNEIECSAMGKAEDMQIAINNIRKISPTIELIVTRGKEGVLYATTTNKITEFAVPKVEKIIDTTAAGDTFTGYYLGNLSLGKTPSDAINFGIKAATLCIQKKGAAESIPSHNNL